MEFAYNNSCQSSINMTPYEVLYDRKYRTPLCWIELAEGKLTGLDLVRQTSDKVKIIKDLLKAALDSKNHMQT